MCWWKIVRIFSNATIRHDVLYEVMPTFADISTQGCAVFDNAHVYGYATITDKVKSLGTLEFALGVRKYVMNVLFMAMPY